MKKIALLIGCLLLAGITVHLVWDWWYSPAGDQAEAVIVIDRGSPLTSVAAELEARGLLRWPQLWTLAARLQKLDSRIKPGEYRIARNTSPAELLQALVQGRVIQYSVTLPEGISLAVALEILQQEGALQATLDGSGDSRLLALVAPEESAEGLFFPDTYIYSRGESDYDILRLAYRRMQAQLNSAWEERDVGLPYKTPYQALIMASIVEKETGLASEREQIAGVFVRRLDKGMRLQTDPTIIYGLGESFDGNLRRRHLEDAANPFNTYRHHGLPPTPIALPGAAAISAAVHPAAGEELYFVARGDGSHQFSRTLDAHQQAVTQYQLRRRKGYRSAPAVESERENP
ncbi:MAG: endolytic transglycosylase MltG [Halieaceae bacterium]